MRVDENFRVIAIGLPVPRYISVSVTEMMSIITYSGIYCQNTYDFVDIEVIHWIHH